MVGGSSNLEHPVYRKDRLRWKNENFSIKKNITTPTTNSSYSQNISLSSKASRNVGVMCRTLANQPRPI